MKYLIVGTGGVGGCIASLFPEKGKSHRWVRYSGLSLGLIKGL